MPVYGTLDALMLVQATGAPSSRYMGVDALPTSALPSLVAVVAVYALPVMLTASEDPQAVGTPDAM